MKRNEQVVRILRVLHHLELNPRGLRALALLEKVNNEGHKCSRETIYRDLRALEHAGFPLENEGKGDEAVWKLNTIGRIREISFTYNEILALFIARESLKSLQHSPLYDTLEAFFDKLEKAMGIKSREALKDLPLHLNIHSGPAWVGSVANEVVDTIHMACTEGHVLEIDYRASSGTRAGTVHTRRVGPEGLHLQNHGIYLIAKDLDDGNYKTFALARISGARMLEDPYQSHGFSIEQFFQDSLGVFNAGQVESIEIFIKEPLASYVSERRWNESQRVIRRPDGIQLLLEVKANDEFLRWVLSLGDHAEVMKPEHLRDQVAELAQKVIKQYQSKRPA